MNTIQHVASRCSVFALMLLMGAALTVTGCDSGLTGPDAGANSAEEALTAKGGGPPGNGGPPGKIDICHYDADTGTYTLINVAASSEDAHRGHGDARPGEAVPTMEGFVFDETCEPTSRSARIAFRSLRDGNAATEIYVTNADGTGQTRLTDTDNDVFNSQPSFSPDGSKIAFTSDRDGNREIYVMNADGTGLARVTNNDAFDAAPSFGPDGKIAFESRRGGTGFEIYVTNADGTGLARVTNNDAGDYEPSFSPDGSKIAFTSDRDGNREIYVMNADGTGLARVTDNDAFDAAPSFGPVAP